MALPRRVPLAGTETQASQEESFISLGRRSRRHLLGDRGPTRLIVEDLDRGQKGQTVPIQGGNRGAKLRPAVPIERIRDRLPHLPGRNVEVGRLARSERDLLRSDRRLLVHPIRAVMVWVMWMLTTVSRTVCPAVIPQSPDMRVRVAPASASTDVWVMPAI